MKLKKKITVAAKPKLTACQALDWQVDRMVPTVYRSLRQPPKGVTPSEVCFVAPPKGLTSPYSSGETEATEQAQTTLWALATLCLESSRAPHAPVPKFLEMITGRNSRMYGKNLGPRRLQLQKSKPKLLQSQEELKGPFWEKNITLGLEPSHCVGLCVVLRNSQRRIYMNFI